MSGQELGSGVCPKCKSEDLDYGNGYVEDESYYYEFTCNNCEASSKEWYNLTYSETLLNEEVGK